MMVFNKKGSPWYYRHNLLDFLHNFAYLVCVVLSTELTKGALIPWHR